MNDKNEALWVSKPDMVEVVRCGKCVHYDPETECCQFWFRMKTPGQYCSEGVKRDDQK